MLKPLAAAGSALLALFAGAAWAAGSSVAPGVAPDPSTLNPAALKLLLPDRVDWQPAAGLSDTDSSVLVGDPAKPGFYVVLNRFHPGAFSRPHYHANDRYILVISGTWWVSTSAAWDPEHNTVPIKRGAFVTHFGRQVHYDGARRGGGDAVVMIFGQGPGARIECEGPKAETGAGPCADAKAAQR